MAISIACISGKGGVGKTTTIINLAAALAEGGRRVLTVDCDPQSNLTSGLGLDPGRVTPTVRDLIAGRLASASSAIVPTAWPNLSVIPATPDLTGVEAELQTSIHRELILRDLITRNGVRDEFDFIFYDTPPNFGFHTLNVLAAIEWVLVPVQMSGYAIRGLKEVLRTVHIARQQLNPDLGVLGIVATFVNPRTNFSRDVLDALRSTPSLRVFDSVVKQTVKLQETTLTQEPIIVHAPTSEAAAAYRRLAEEVLARV